MNNKEFDELDERILQVLKQVEEEKKIKQRKRNIKIVIVIVTIFILLATCIFSKIKAYTYNPIRAVIGYVAVKIFNVEHIEVQNIPRKVIYSKRLGF